MAGNPPISSAQAPGVVTRKLRVLRNIPTASRLPAADTRGSQGRAAIRSPTRTSVAPRRFDSPWTPKAGYVQANGGLFSTNGRMPSASTAVNFIPPILGGTVGGLVVAELVIELCQQPARFVAEAAGASFKPSAAPGGLTSFAPLG